MDFDIYALIDRLKTRTAMYTGKKTLSHIRCYIDAYGHAMQDCGYHDRGAPDFSDFPRWVAKKYGFSLGNVSYPEILLAVSLGISPDDVEWDNVEMSVTPQQHAQGVDLFFENIHEYRLAQ